MRRRVATAMPEVRAGLADRLRRLIDLYDLPGWSAHGWRNDLARLESGEPVVKQGWELPRGAVPVGRSYDWFRLESDGTVVQLDGRPW